MSRFSFWHPFRVEQLRLLIDADIEADPKIGIPDFRKQTRRFTKVMLISQFYGEETQPDHDPGRTDKIRFYEATTAKVAVPLP